jgi:hypothetical protein
MSGRYDDMLFMLAQDLGSIDRILFEFFGFLKRRTDFFVLANPGDAAGFPPGASEQMIYKTYQHFREEYNREHPFTPKSRPTPPSQPIPEVVIPKEEPKTQEISSEASKQDPPKVKVDSSISTYNGASTENYKWSQDLSDVTLQFPLPANTKSKDINVKFDTKHLKVVVKSEVIIDSDLPETIHKQNSYWNIDEGSLVVNLEKSKDCVWKSAFAGHAEIDPKTVDTSRRVDEYDEETQVGIRKVMYEHERKLKGLPSTEEEKAQNALMDMWKKSEFKDQPFDMSKIPLICKPAPQENPDE